MMIMLHLLFRPATAATSQLDSHGLLTLLGLIFGLLESMLPEITCGIKPLEVLAMIGLVLSLRPVMVTTS